MYYEAREEHFSTKNAIFLHIASLDSAIHSKYSMVNSDIELAKPPFGGAALKVITAQASTDTRGLGPV